MKNFLSTSELKVDHIYLCVLTDRRVQYIGKTGIQALTSSGGGNDTIRYWNDVKGESCEECVYDNQLKNLEK